jgi:deoxyribose-phosphate aldolase
MDQEQLIEKIVAEVLAKMGGRAGSPAEAPIRAAAASAFSRPALSPAEVARYIDHTLLRPESVPAAYDKLCEEALKYGFFSVCVNSSRVAYVSRRLQGSEVKVCSVVGFPHGNMTSRTKAFETREAIAEGASEIDMVINVGMLKEGDLKAFEEDIRAVRRATRSNTVLKVIIETSLLGQGEKVLACEIAKKAGADFVKTSTGFSSAGATVEDIALMRQVVGPDMGVKASGGIKTYKAAIAMIGAGATRIGCGSSVSVVTDQVGTEAY